MGSVRMPEAMAHEVRDRYLGRRSADVSTRTTDPFDRLSGMLSDVVAINERLAEAAAVCNVLTPSLRCSSLAPGCEVSFDVVRIGPRESYDVGGKKALHRTALLRLASAAGFSLNPRTSRRTDDRRHPYVVTWHEEGGWMDLHGNVQLVPGDYNIDLRDGSAQSEEVLHDAKGANEQERETKGRITLMARRSNILELAQSGAQDKAIRTALAIPSYTYDEIARPFVVARLLYTGHDDNPAFALENRREIRAKMLGGTSALFGHVAAPQLTAATAPLALPAIDMVEPPPEPKPTVVCEFCGTESAVTVAEAPRGPIAHCAAADCVALAHANLRREQAEELADTRTAKTSAPSAPSYPRASAPSPAPRAGVASPPTDAPGTTPPGGTRGRGGGGGDNFARSRVSGLVVPAADRGQWAGRPIEEAPDEVLIHWEGRLRTNLARGKTPAKFVASDTALRNAMRGELDSRGGAGRGEDDIPY